MSYFTAYLLLKLNDIWLLFLIASTVVGLSMFCITLAHIPIYGLDNSDFPKTTFKKLIAVFAFTVTVTILLPSTKQAIGIWILPKIMNNEDITESIEKLPKAINLYLDELMFIMEPVKVEEIVQ